MSVMRAKVVENSVRRLVDEVHVRASEASERQRRPKAEAQRRTRESGAEGALESECPKRSRLVQALHRRAPQDATFEQVGILDGRETVLEFLAHGELGCAVEHLLYMVDESAITLSAEQAQGVEGLRRWLSASR